MGRVGHVPQPDRTVPAAAGQGEEHWAGSARIHMRDCLIMERSAPVLNQVPYFSQWESPQLVPLILSGNMRASDDPLWPQSGATSPEEYEFWSWRVCGMACLRMALAYWRKITPATIFLAKECVSAGAYILRGDSVDGLIYAPFCTYVSSRWSLQSESYSKLPAKQISGYLQTGRLIILSVHPSIRNPAATPPRQGGHLVLAVGATRNHLLIHNPSGLPDDSQQFAAISWLDFNRFYAKRGIVLGP
jgi:peptidase C39-like protein